MSEEEIMQGSDPHGGGGSQRTESGEPMPIEIEMTESDSLQIESGAIAPIDAEAGRDAEMAGGSSMPSDSSGSNMAANAPAVDTQEAHPKRRTKMDICIDNIVGPYSIYSVLVEILHPNHLAVTLNLWLVWIITAFSYYGLVLLATQLAVNEGGGCGDDGSVPLTN